MAKRRIVLAIRTTDESRRMIRFRTGTFTGAPGRGSIKGGKALLVGGTLHIFTRILDTGSVLD